MQLTQIEDDLIDIIASVVEPDGATGTLFNLQTMFRWEFYFDSGKNLDLKCFDRLGE